MSSRNPNRGEDAPRDVRPPARAELVVDAIVRAAAGLDIPATTGSPRPMAKERLWYQPPESFARMRQFFAALPDDERRRVLVHMLLDEVTRIADERSLSWQTVHAGAS